MISLGEILDLLAIDVIAVGLVAMASFVVFRSIWRATTPHAVGSLGAAWHGFRGLLADGSAVTKAAILLVPAAIAGMAMDHAANELLDGHFVESLPALPPSLGDILDCDAWRASAKSTYREEDEIKVHELAEISQRVSEAHRRILGAFIPGLGGLVDEDDLERHSERVKGLYQHATAVVNASGKADLLASLRSEERATKIFRIFLLGLWITLFLSIYSLVRYLVTQRSKASPRVVLRETFACLMILFLGLLAVRLWSEQSARLYKRLLHGYLAVAPESNGSASSRAVADTLHGSITPVGEFPHAGDVSAIARLKEQVLIATDEGASLYAFDVKGCRGESAACTMELAAVIELGVEGELDAEAIAIGSDAIFVAGSHSLKRAKAIPPGRRSAAENRKRFEPIAPDPSRARLVRIPLDEAGRIAEGVRPYSYENLRSRMTGSILEPFLAIPGKENGVDVEGLAVVPRQEDGNRVECLFAGLRSPVLRHGLATVFVTAWGGIACGSEVRLLDLGGLGIRDMTAVDGGILVLAGPAAEEDGPFEVFFWDGEDGTPGQDREPLAPTRLGRVDPPLGASAEGLTVIGVEDDCYDLIFVFDGWTGGAPTARRMCRPR